MPKELCYLEGDDFNDYMYDMDLCQKFATENRFEIARRITNYLGLNIDELDKFETIHNYINMNDKILRKGSISAYDNEIVLIPMNMRDGCIIAKGKSNSDYNYSAPHGAGRVMSRGEAFRTLTVDDFKKSMDGIYTTTADETTLDESPFVYKPMQSILNNIKDTVDVLEIIKPVYNFKSAE
jgi:RNA-splicing ligase RtcB